MGNSFETITVLQYRLKEAQEELAAFQSGEKYIRMEKQHLTQVRALERRIAKLEAAVAKEHSHAITIRNQWFEIFEQLQKECDRMVAEAVKKADMMEKRAIRAERQRDTALEKVTFQRRELYKVKTELDDEKQKVQKLTAQINRNYENRAACVRCCFPFGYIFSRLKGLQVLPVFFQLCGNSIMVSKKFPSYRVLSLNVCQICQ